MGPPTRGPIEISNGHTADSDSALRSHLNQDPHAVTDPFSDANGPHLPRPYRLFDRIDTEDQHFDRVSSAPANAAARSRQPTMVGIPASCGRSAPRSIAGTARSSSGPSARPVKATRMGWNSALP